MQMRLREPENRVPQVVNNDYDQGHHVKTIVKQVIKEVGGVRHIICEQEEEQHLDGHKQTHVPLCR